jgi:CheY-like chemotaxis protein
VSYKILLADDSVTVQKIITLTFSDEGVDVVTVNNGDEAVNRLQHMRPALVMADVSIPGRNGYEICEFVKTHPVMKDTPVILLVPAFEPFDEARARRIGADFHLTKPFQSIRTLISTVKSLVERKAAPEVSMAAGGLTAVQGSDQAPSEAAEMDPKRAKIEELIRLSVESPAEDSVEDEVLAIIEDQSAVTVNGPVVMDARVSTVALAEDMDNVLELDEPPVAHIPQSVIDEIVSRVVAQLSEKLSDEIAHRVAPEVAELVKQQRLAEPGAYRDADNLLDLD